MSEYSPEVASHLYMALDYGSIFDERAQTALTDLRGVGAGAKVGLEMAGSVGWSIPINEVQENALNVFADMKVLDMRNTVLKAARRVLEMQPAFLNTFASASDQTLVGLRELRDSVQIDVPEEERTKLLAVTILTDTDDDECLRDYGRTRIEQVLHYTGKVAQLGFDGVVCSGADLAEMSKVSEFDGLVRMTPAIRPKWANPDDQKNIVTPSQALNDGGPLTHLVVGRPITEQFEFVGSSPLDATHAILEEMASTGVLR